MESANPPAPVSKKMLWAGYVLSALPVLLLLFSATLKFMKPPAVVEGFAHLGLPEWLTLGLGVLELSCTLIYLVPRTAVLGAILLSGFFGGATLAHLRVGDSFIMPAVVGVLLWGGLFLREPRLRELIPLRRPISRPNV